MSSRSTPNGYRFGARAASVLVRRARHAVELAEYGAVRKWLRRVEAQDNFVNDLVPYLLNAMAGAGRSIYE